MRSYADLNEPFTVYYDKNVGKSRSDFYGDLYQVYQFSPDKSSNETRYGSLYKFAWVPASFQPHSSAANANEQPNSDEKTRTRRACFKDLGSDINSISAQGVLPDMSSFEFDSITDCPSTNTRHLHSKCELWKKTTKFSDKTNTYKFWLKRNSKNQPIPVQYYMQGYDTLLGSHYDRYDFKYLSYSVDGASDNDFRFLNEGIVCESMPGPGDESAPEHDKDASRRSHSIVQNPLHEFFEQPHRYDHVDYDLKKHTNEHRKEYPNHWAVKAAWKNLLHNMRIINSHNRRSAQFKLHANKFSDRSLGELSYLRGRFHNKNSKQQYNGGLPYKRSSATNSMRGLNLLARNNSEFPESWDWRIRGAVTPVKDQAVCGSCWSFGTSGTIEGALFVKTGKLVRLSQQQMVDCSWAHGNNGCDGGEDFRAYQYLMESGGLASEDAYGHYKGVDAKCHDNDVPKSVKLTGFYNVTPNSVEDMKDALIKYGPVTIAIDASPPTFTFYSHGVFYDKNCKNGPNELDHQVLVVGYGKLDNQEYWLVKNSWSTLWGNDGYILISMRDNNCGVLTVPTVPIVEAVNV